MITTTIEWAPEHLRAGVLAMQKELLGHGKYRAAKRNKPLPPWEVSIDGARCALFLSEWLGGLHHLPPSKQPHEIDWSNRFVELSSYNFNLATFDMAGLTKLVVLAHEHAIRAELSPNMMNIRLLLSPRDARCEAGLHFISSRHASLAELRGQIEARIARIEKHGRVLEAHLALEKAAER